MTNANPQADQITGHIGDKADQVAVGKNISQTKNVYVMPRPTDPPLHYPPRAEHFVDRVEALKKLLADLHPGRVVTLCGPGGIGKSALAAEALAQLAADATQPPARFPDGVFFHSFYNQKEAALALEQIARSFGEEPRPTPALAAQRALAGKRALLLLDGAEDADDLPAVLAVRGHCGVLVTSRLRQDAVAARQDVQPLPPDEAMALLQAWGGPRAGDVTAARQICALVAELPLAVRLAGRYLAETEMDATDYLAWLRATPLAALDQGKRRDQSVAVLMARSLDRISEAAQQALSVVGVLALTPFAADLMALALDLATPQAAVRLLGELVNYGLLLRQPDGQYAVSHALIHTYTSEPLTAPTTVIERLAVYFTQFATEQAKLGPPGFVRLDAVLPHIMAVLDGCVHHAVWGAANQLVLAIHRYLSIHGRWSERAEVLQVGVQAAQITGNRYDEGAHTIRLGNVYSALGQVDKAIDHYERSLEIYRELNDHRNERAVLDNLGHVYRDLGQVDKAIEYHQQALAIAQASGDRRGEGTCLGSLGIFYRRLGQVGKAIEYYQQALVIAQEFGDRSGEGACLGSLGNFYRALGQVDKAIEYNQQALAIAQEFGDRGAEGTHLGGLGNAYADLGQVDKAIEYYQQALVIAREIGHRSAEGSSLGNLGNAYADLGQVDKAIEYNQQALVIAQEIGDRSGEGAELGSLGLAYRKLGQVDRAIEYYQQALVIAQEIGDRRRESNRLDNLGSAYYTLGQKERAATYYQQQLAIAREIDHRSGEGHALWGLGLTQRDAGNHQEARILFTQALHIFKAIQSPSAQTVRGLLEELEQP